MTSSAAPPPAPLPPPPAPLPPLPRRLSRRLTYALVIGSASVLAAAGAGIPLLFGTSTQRPVAAGTPVIQQGPPGVVADPVAPPGLSAPPPPAAASPLSAVPSASAVSLPGAPTPGAVASMSPSRAAARGRLPAGRPAPTVTHRGLSSASGKPTTKPSAVDSTGQALTASATGVTPTTVTLGALLTDLGGASAAGAAITGYSPSQQQEYFDAFASDVNSHGGVGGRTLKMAYETSDIIDGNSQKQACDDITDNDKSFAVTSVLGIYGPPILCLTQTHGVPYIANDGAVSDYYPESKGLLFTLQPSTLRTESNAIYEDATAGEFKAGDKVGFLREDQYLAPDELAVEKYLSGFGVTVTDAVMSASSLEDAPAQAAVAAQRFCSAGDTKVFFAVNSLYAEDFISSLPPGCAPSYYTSDFDYQMDGETFVSGMPNSYFNHAIGVSSSDVGSSTLTPSEQSCLTAYNTYETAHGKPAVASTDEQAIQAIAACGLVRTFVAGFDRAGPNPTVASFSSALAGIGSFDDPAYEDAEFAPGKTDAPDGIRTVQANLACKCWKPTGDGSFHLAHFR